MTAKQCAIRDIKKYLKQENQVFIAFREELDPVMNKLEKEYIEHQNNGKSWCLSGWSFSCDL